MLDLNEKRAARIREAKGEPVIVKLGDETFELPVELPLEAVETMVDAANVEPGEYLPHIKKFIRTLMGDEQFEKFYKIASREDLSEFVSGVAAEYGLTVGESTASLES